MRVREGRDRGGEVGKGSGGLSTNLSTCLRAVCNSIIKGWNAADETKVGTNSSRVRILILVSVPHVAFTCILYLSLFISLSFSFPLLFCLTPISSLTHHSPGHKVTPHFITEAKFRVLYRLYVSSQRCRRKRKSRQNNVLLLTESSRFYSVLKQTVNIKCERRIYLKSSNKWTKPDTSTSLHFSILNYVSQFQEWILSIKVVFKAKVTFLEVFLIFPFSF